MKRKITFLLAALLLMSGLSWAQQITWSASDQGYTNGEAIESVSFNDYVAGAFFKGTNNNAPKYYNTGAAIRCYGGNYFTITSDYALTEIVLGFASGEGTNAITTSVGSYENGTWTGSANEVTFTINGTSGHRRIASFTITYDEGGTPTPPAPSITASNVSIDYDATEGEIVYTINNAVAAGELTAATEDEWLTIGTIGETVPFTCSVNDNGERTATVTLTYTFNTDQTVTKNVTVTQGNNPNAPGTEGNPYTVAQARAAIDAGTGIQGVYATGIVSEIVTAYSSQYGNITFDIVDAAGDQEFLRVYRCAGEEAANVTVGDIAVVYGNLILYNNSIYEFAQGCQVVSLEHPVITDPYITAENVSIEFDATSGSIAYEIENPANDGVLTASVPEESWIILGDDFTSPIAFTCSANPTSSPRTETVTLTYTYGDNQTATKDVTVTQAGNPNIVDLISDITEVGTAYTVRGTVVAKNSRGFVLGDGTGYVYYYKNAAPSQSVGDMVTISGTTGTYGQIIQFTNAATVSEATTSNYDGTPEVTVITEVPDYTQGYHLSDYLQFEGLLEKSNNNYLITLGEAQIQISYPTSEQGTELTALNGKDVLVKGYFSGINSSSRFSVMLESVEEIISTEPSITVEPAIVNAPFTTELGMLDITYENIPEPISFDLLFCDANGDEVEAPNWIYAEISEPTGIEGYAVSYLLSANEGEARTLYFKVYTFVGAELVEVYSNLVTINQAAYVAPTYAALPFEFNGGKADIENTDGLYQQGLGSDYSSAPKLKFDGTDDYLLLQFLEEPDTLAFDIKGNNFSGGTFTVQVSADGETYTDWAIYTELGAVQHDKYAINSDVRYIKWVYTEKVTGNVALGNITLSKYEATGPSIILNTNISVPAEGGIDIIPVEYVDIDDSYYPELLYYNENLELVDPSYYQEWITLNFDDNDNVQYNCDPNTTIETRSIFFKILAHDYDYNEVISDLVTITQEAYVAPSYITVSPDEVTLDAGEHLINYLDLAYENIEVENTQSFTVHYYNAEGEEIQPVQGETWMVAGVVKPEDVYQVIFTVIANEGEARTAYFKVSCGETYSNLVTINQEAYVAPAVATVTVEPALIEATAAETEGTLTVTYENITNIYAAVYFYDADGNETTFDWITADMDEDNNVYYLIDANEGEARTAYLQVWAFDDNYEYVASNMVTINQAAGTTPVVEGWVLTNLADLTENDVFVIVGTDMWLDMFAMSNDNSTTSAPAAVEVEVVDDMLSAEPAANLQWNLSITENGYIFYPNGDTENWLFCNTTNSNNRVRVGTGTNNVFVMDASGYLKCGNYYIGVYDSQDWRGYTSYTGNISDQTFSFYKKSSVGTSIIAEPALVEATAAETNGTITITYNYIDFTSLEIHFFAEDGVTVAEYDWLQAEFDDYDNVYYQISANDGEARTAYFKVYGLDIDANVVYSNLVTISQEAPVAPVTGGWVLTDLADLTEGDVFVIVGTTVLTETFALPNTITGNNAPEVVAIEVDDENNKLTEEPADNIQWNISRQGDSYTFYPNGDAENWLYFKSSNNGVRVGNDNNNTFYMDNDDYLVNEGTSRYLSIYYNTNLHQAQDWRCYNNTNSAVAISFYKKVVEHETYTLAINGYGDSEGGYRLIASPVYVNPANVEGMTEGNFDLYQFDQSQEDEWRNYEAENGQFNLVPGKGYLYAHDTDVELTFTGTPYSGDGTITLTKDDNATFSGWNLVGNPFGNWAYIDRDYYAMNEAGTEIIAGENNAIAPMQGIFVIAAENGEEMTFVEEEWGPAYPVKGINLNISQNTNAVIDRTIVRFGEGRQLPKFQLYAESTKLYIPQGNNDYAVVRSAAYGEMPVNFKAQNNGTYTISVDAENLETSYLHLIDNMTGNDIDLLQVPTYTFEATTSDYTSRFRLVFNITGVEENMTGTEPFAFFNGSEWVVSNIGKATLQMVDLTGRILSSESISGNATVSTNNLSTGIYLMRLVNGENVKTQKVVVK